MAIPSRFNLARSKRGDGIGYYINDLNAEGGQDGAFDAAANVIRVLTARAGAEFLYGCSRQRGPAPPARAADSDRQHVPILTPGAELPVLAL